MGNELLMTAGVTLIGVLALATLILLVDFFRSRDQRNWREELRMLQLENNRYLKKVHEENTRFFRSIGLTTQQIFERVDRGLDGDRRD